MPANALDKSNEFSQTIYGNMTCPCPSKLIKSVQWKLMLQEITIKASVDELSVNLFKQCKFATSEEKCNKNFCNSNSQTLSMDLDKQFCLHKLC